MLGRKIRQRSKTVHINKRFTSGMNKLTGNICKAKKCDGQREAFVQEEGNRGGQRGGSKHGDKEKDRHTNHRSSKT